MNEIKFDEIIENTITVLVITGIIPFAICIALIGLAGWLIL